MKHRARELTLLGLLRPFLARFGWATLYFATVAIVGMFGYRLIEGWSWLNCLYMAMITLTSVGFLEVQPLSVAGRTFTMVLLPFGIIGLGLFWALMTAVIVEADLAGLLRRRKAMRKLEKLKQHFVICGAGRMGRVIIDEVNASQTPWVAIEHDPARVEQLNEEIPGGLIIEGDATKEQTLQQARIEEARGVACCLRDDAENLLLCMTVRGLKPDVEIVARAYDQESLAKLRRAGATHAISPNFTGAVRMAAALLRPSVVSFLDAATAAGRDISLRMEQANITGDSRLVGLTLADAKIPQRTGLIVLAMRRRGAGPPTYNPGPEMRIEPGDEMIVLGRPEQLERLRAYVGNGASSTTD